MNRKRNARENRIIGAMAGAVLSAGLTGVFGYRALKLAGAEGELLLQWIHGMVLAVFVLVLIAAFCRILVRRGSKKDAEENLTDAEANYNTAGKTQQDIVDNARMRQEFTANVTHELKTPLTSISGYAELIESGIASEEDVIRFATGIRKSADRLLTLINDIIRLSELDDTAREEHFERLNLFELARTSVEMLSINAEKHNVTIHFSGAESYVRGDRQMIEELLYNLCDNAIRYNNEDGRVDVSVMPGGNGTVLQVKDTGIGIPPEHQERIFERFYRVDKSRSKSTGGTGLGLAIVKHILARHEASIQLTSELGKGTCITVTFPQ